MFYRILDKSSQTYLSMLYNLESKTDIKEEMKNVLLGDISLDDMNDITKLSWDVYKNKLEDMGYEIECQPTPFEQEPNNSGMSWEEYLEEESQDDNDYWDEV